MPYFDRFDICAAHAALEYDWHCGGILRERPSNSRRNESTSVQLRRLGYMPARYGGFESLENDNQREIYCNALQACGFTLSHRDSSHAAIIAFLAGA